MNASYPPALVDRVLRQIDRDRDEIIALEQALIRHPSETGDEKACQAFLADWLRAAGYAVDVFTPDEVAGGRNFRGQPLAVDYSQRPNVVAIHKGAGGGRSLMLMAHVDTVPIGPPEQWRVPPLGGEIHAGKIYGRGAQDDKEGIVAQTFAVEAIRRAGLQLGGDVILCSVVDEEGGGSMGSWACFARGYRAEAGIYLDGLEMKIHPANLGWSGATIRLRTGTSQMHIGRAKAGADAVYAALLALRDERRPMFERHPAYKGTDWPANNLIVPYLLAGHPGGVAMNQAILGAFLYSLPGQAVDADRRVLETHVRQAWAALGWDAPEPEFEWNATWVDPYEVATDAPIVAALREGSRLATGTPMPIEGAPASDLHIMGNFSGGMPAVATGPGQFGLPESAHQPNESISIDGVLLPFVKTVAATIITWCGGVD
jgi:acetylornithine deacetylase